MENSFEIWNEWEGVELYCEDNIKVLATLADNLVDAVITDPPAGISFMNKKWDANKGGRSKWIAWLASVLRECYRVMKPGGALLVWALPRTSHWTGMAIEDAGFRPVDVITHLFGSGFPKSHSISKTLDKLRRRDCVQAAINLGIPVPKHNLDNWIKKNCAPSNKWWKAFKESLSAEDWQLIKREVIGNGKGGQTAWFAKEQHAITAPATPEAKLWEGWGTSLKPACENWWLAFKPREGTYANNALKHDVAGLWIDGGRIELQVGETTHGSGVSQSSNPNTAYGDMGIKRTGVPNINSTKGRWPANLILSHSPGCTQEQDAWDCEEGCAVRLLGEQSGERPPGYRHNPSTQSGSSFHNNAGAGERGYKDKGTAARFFLNLPPDACRFKYQAKASRKERNYGLEDGQVNTHATVKSVGLMKYLCTLVKPPTGGVLLDPFMGSGSTGVAAVELVEQEWDFIGIDNNQNSFDIAKARINQACEDVEEGEK